MPRELRQTLALLCCAFLLLWLVRQANHYLAPLAVQLSLGGLVVALPALRTGRNTGLAVAFVSGLLCDAFTAGPAFGLHAALFATVSTLVHGLRHRFPREDLTVAVVVALFANLALLLAQAFLLAPDWSDPAAGWMRFFADLLVSQLVLALVSTWYFSLQARALGLAGADLLEEPRSLK